MQTIPLPQFTGKDYTPFSSKADAQRLMCLYRETIQSGDGETDYVLYKTPGMLAQFTQGSDWRGIFELNDTIFAVIDATLVNLDSAYAPAAVYPGAIANDGKPVVFCANPDTLVFTSAGILYAVNAGAVTMPAITGVALSCAFIQGYFVYLSTQNQFYFSVDGLTWNAIDFQTVESSANSVIAMIADHNELWMLGNRITSVYTVGTDPNTPFVQRQDAFIQEGIAAASSVVAMDEGLLWVAKNKNGDRVVVRTSGFQSQTVSTYEQANILRQMATVDDCIGLSFQLNGHRMCWFVFPSENVTLGYDATENEWYRVGYWNALTSAYERVRANCVASAFGKILVGDYANGILYDLSPDHFDDNGNAIRWVRECPHITKNGKRVEIAQLSVFGQTGVGLAVASNVNGYNPSITLQYSQDGGETWSDEEAVSMGKIGEYGVQMFWNRLGIADDWVFRFLGTDPVKIALTGASFEAEVMAF